MTPERLMCGALRVVTSSLFGQYVATCNRPLHHDGPHAEIDSGGSSEWSDTSGSQGQRP